MAKVTVYVSDDQLARLKQVKGYGKGGISKAFQAFLEAAASGSGPSGRFDYARKVMPVSSALERHARRVAASIQEGGLASDGGPIALALAVLIYQEAVKRQPDLGAALAKEFTRFGLDDVVGAETEGVDLTVEPEPTEADIEEGDDEGWAGFGPIAFDIGNEVRDALKNAGIGAFWDPSGRGAGGRGRARHRARFAVGSDDDPADLLSAADFETFKKRHTDWAAGQKLTPSQVETVRDLLFERISRRRRGPGAESAEDE